GYGAGWGGVAGARLLSPGGGAWASTRLTTGSDACLQVEMAFGLGFMVHGPFTPMFGAGSFGHAGAGGSLGYAHPGSGVAFGFVMNQMTMNLTGDERIETLTAAVQSCL